MMESALDALIAHLGEATRWNAAAEAAPVALVWCDPASECGPIIPTLRARLRQLLTLGNHAADARTGPAFWLRAAVDRAITSVEWSPDAIPVVWLPGVGREQLRGAEDCPPNIAPLVWFSVAGQFYGHRNGKDWTLRALLGSEYGPLGLDIAEDGLTRAALARAAPRLLGKSLTELRGRRWDADALDGLLSGDLDSDMLDWIDGVLDATGEPERFAAFSSRALREFGIDPATTSTERAARLLAERDGAWERLWRRFEASTSHPGVVRRLSVLEAPADFLADTSAYPRANAAAEDELRRTLSGISALDLQTARDRIAKLEAKHAVRRLGAWAKRGMAPLAQALEHLAIVASAPPLPDHGPEALAEAYAEAGWRIDQAALAAYAAAPREADRAAITVALRALYLPWLDSAATALQELARSGRVEFAKPASYDGPGTLMFVDGLRLDVAHLLVDRLAAAGADVDLKWSWSGFPTVTATCKSLVSPVAEHLSGGVCGPDFLPTTAEGRPANKAAIDKLMSAEGWSIGTLPLGDQRMWIETGRFDTDGHALEDRLADQINGAIDDLAEQVLGLARNGRSLRIVTDHGWLWMPGGLPTAALPAGLAQDDGKRTRCALLKEGVEAGFARIPWSWNEDVRIAAATGARSFFKSYAYAHGGVSPQECVLPVIDVAAMSAGRALRIANVEWTGLRLRLEVEGGADLTVDLREATGASLLTALRSLDGEGKTSFPVNSDYEGAKAMLVVLDDDGRILLERRMAVGQTDG